MLSLVRLYKVLILYCPKLMCFTLDLFLLESYYGLYPSNGLYTNRQGSFRIKSRVDSIRICYVRRPNICNYVCFNKVPRGNTSEEFICKEHCKGASEIFLIGMFTKNNTV